MCFEKFSLAIFWIHWLRVTTSPIHIPNHRPLLFSVAPFSLQIEVLGEALSRINGPERSVLIFLVDHYETQVSATVHSMKLMHVRLVRYLPQRQSYTMLYLFLYSVIILYFKENIILIPYTSIIYIHYMSWYVCYIFQGYFRWKSQVEIQG